MDSYTTVTFHISTSRDMFSSYEKCTGIALMGNDHACKVVGIRSVRIKMFDGIVRTLIEVQHIPEMNKNLISFGTPDRKGFRYSGGCGVLRVSSSVLTVVHGHLDKGLYFSYCSTIIGVMAVSSLLHQDSGTAKLWHMQLGYISKRGLSVLSK